MDRSFWPAAVFAYPRRARYPFLLRVAARGKSHQLLEARRARANSRDEGWRLWDVVLAILLLNHWSRARHEECRRGVAALERGWERVLAAMMFQLLNEPALAAGAPRGADPQSQQ